MSEMIEIICPVCCAHVLHEGRIISGSATDVLTAMLETASTFGAPGSALRSS